jgi:hypothetical protein
MLFLSQARNCTNRTCIEFRIQHRNATLKKLELERDLTATRLKYDMLFEQITTQGVAATARAAAIGEEAFRLPNGELMTAEKFLERTQMLTQTRASLERSDAKLRKVIEENAQIKREKESAVNESRRLEILLSRFEQSRRYEVFTSDMHRETLEENSRLVDLNEKMQKQLSELQEEVMILKARRGPVIHSDDSSSSPGMGGIRVTSAYIGSDGRIPALCPVGGCTHYDSVHRGQDVMKNFQNHMNNTHRVSYPFFNYYSRRH